MSEQMPRFKLNRIQRKNFVRTLMQTVRNMDSGGRQLGHNLEQRKQAAKLLIEFGNDEEVYTTFNNQINSADPSDMEFNQFILELMAHGYRTGIQEAGEGDESEG